MRHRFVRVPRRCTLAGETRSLAAPDWSFDMKHLVVGLVLLVAGCAPSGELVFSAEGIEVESWETVDPAPMNAKVASAVAAGETWPTSPLAITVDLFGGDVDTRILSLEERKNRTEGADTTVVVLIRDGFLDDSVRGDWHRIVYARQEDWTWRVHSVRRAYRCYRRDHLESFSRDLCL